MNPDGTVTIGSPLTIRPAVTPTIQPQQIRIMNSDDQQQIRVISTSGNDSSLSPGSFRIITSGQQQFDGGTRGKLMTSSNVGMKSPVKAITLSQAQQMGILSGGQILFTCPGTVNLFHHNRWSRKLQLDLDDEVLIDCA